MSKDKHPPDEQAKEEAPKTVTIPNETSRDQSLATFSIGPGDTVRIEEDNYVTIFSKENFKKVADWFSAYI